MAFRIELTDSAKKQLGKLDQATASSRGKALTGPLGTYWRYRVGDFRIICDIQDDALRVLVIRIGNRRDV